MLFQLPTSVTAELKQDTLGETIMITLSGNDPALGELGPSQSIERVAAAGTRLHLGATDRVLFPGSLRVSLRRSFLALDLKAGEPLIPACRGQAGHTTAIGCRRSRSRPGPWKACETRPPVVC